MASPETTLASAIITRARNLSDSNTPTPTVDFVTDAELLDYLNQAYKELIDLIADSSDAAIELMAKTATLTSPWTLPADFYRALTIDVPRDTASTTNPWMETQMFSIRGRNRYWNERYPAWRIVGGAIVWEPPTTTIAQARVWYIPNFTELSATSSTVTTYNGWDAFLTGTLIMNILAKNEQDTSLGRQMREEARKRIETACSRITLADTARPVRKEFYNEDQFDDTGYWGRY
jgi:hypothetical protein